MKSKRWKFMIFSAPLIITTLLSFSHSSRAQEDSTQFETLKARQTKLLNLQKRNNAMLKKLPESEFSARIKIKSNLVIISTELQNIQDQLEHFESSGSEKTESKESP